MITDPVNLIDGVPACRSGDCKGKAEFRAEIPRRFMKTQASTPRLLHEGWEGDFCHYHLMRALELKIFEVGFHDTLKIKRIAA